MKYPVPAGCLDVMSMIWIGQFCQSSMIRCAYKQLDRQVGRQINGQ